MPNRLANPQSVDDLLLYRLSHLLAVAGGPVIRLCEGRFGITRREWRVLALLAQHGNLLSSDLAERAQLDRARTSKAITSLVAKKMLNRQIQQSDRRKATLSLTQAGLDVYNAMFPLVLRINADLLAGLDAPVVANLDEALAALQTRANGAMGMEGLPKANRRRGGATSRNA